MLTDSLTLALSSPEDVQSIVSAKLALKYAGPQVGRVYVSMTQCMCACVYDAMYAVMSMCRVVFLLQIEAMQNIAKASQDRSVAEFEQVACTMVSVTILALNFLSFSPLLFPPSLPPSLPPLSYNRR